jgi:hypothetical protein
MNYEKKYKVLIDVLKIKVKRLREQKRDVEMLIDQGVASSRQKQDFVEIRAKIEAYEDAIDLAEGMKEDKQDECT